jgi:putative DNA primase/helicase
MSAYKTALLGQGLGFWIVPPKEDGTKAPDVDTWRSQGAVRPDEDQIDRWYLQDSRDGVGLVCGAASGNLEAIDFDAVEAYDEFVSTARDLGWGDLIDKIEDGYLERSPGGVHWLYYCSEIGGNDKLARRSKLPDEMKHPKDRIKTLIETRAEGGYIIIAPTSGAVHETGRPYVLERGSLRSIVTLTPDERRDLLALARTFDQMPEQPRQEAPTSRESRQGAGRPGDDFVSRSTWEDVLTPHGWRAVRRTGTETFWRRPGKDRGQSATTNYHGSDLLYVFSSSTEFEAERGYNRFSAYSILEHNGDWGAAASALRTQGYGQPINASVSLGRIRMNGTDGRSGVEEEADDIVLASGRLPLTDMGNAERFAERFADRVRYSTTLGEWLIFDGRHHRIDTSHEILLLSKDVARQFRLVELVEGLSEKRQKAVIKHWARLESTHGSAAMLTMVKGELPLERVAGRTIDDLLDPNPWLLNVKNGTVDLRTGEIREHRYADWITKFLDIDYDPGAVAPRWERFLRESWPLETIRTYLHRAAGYSATGSARERRVVVLHGVGRNGKGTFVKTLREVLGGYARRAPTEMLMSKNVSTIPNDVADLRGIRLAYVSEVGENRHLDEAMVKDLTGGEDIPARKLYGPWFTFRPTFTMWMLFNHKPIIRGTDRAIWDRIDMVPCDVRFRLQDEDDDGSPLADPYLDDELRKEQQGILAWVVRGAADWYQHGLGRPAEIRAATEEYRQEMDFLGKFLAENVIHERDSSVRSRDLFTAYVEWCKGSGEEPKSEKMFALSMTERGFTRAKGRQANVWQGLRLRAAMDDSAEGDV